MFQYGAFTISERDRRLLVGVASDCRVGLTRACFFVRWTLSDNATTWKKQLVT